MIAPRHPLCELLRREHRAIHLSLMASCGSADEGDEIRAFVAGHLRFEDRLIVPMLRRWLPPTWPASHGCLTDGWRTAKRRDDRVALRRVLAAIAQRIAEEERVLLPLIERHLTADDQYRLIEQTDAAGSQQHACRS